MRSASSYKKQMTLKDTILEIMRMSGRQFGPEIVKVFIKILERENAPRRIFRFPLYMACIFPGLYFNVKIYLPSNNSVSLLNLSKALCVNNNESALMNPKR